MAHTAVGFKGTVRQDAEARRLGRLGPPFTVAGAGDWAVTPATGDRMVSIAAGSGQAGGVTDTTNAAELMQLPANTADKERFDLIVNRFRWTDPVTLPAFTYITGVPGAGVPNAAGLTRILGSQYDGVLSVVRVAPGQGALSGNDCFDLRVRGGEVGPLITGAEERYLELLDRATSGDIYFSKTDRTWIRRASGAWRPTTSVCTLRQTTAQGIDAVYRPMNFQDEDVDTDGAHNTTTPTRWTAPWDDWWQMSGTAAFEANDAAGTRAARFNLDGIEKPVRGSVVRVPADRGQPVLVAMPTISLYLLKGQFVDLVLNQDSGQAMQTLVNADAHCMMSVRLAR